MVQVRLVCIIQHHLIILPKLIILEIHTLTVIEMPKLFPCNNMKDYNRI